MDKLSVDERHDFAREITVIARRWRVRLDERLKELDVSQARWAALFWLGHSQDGVSQAILADRAGIEPPTLVRIIDKLQQQGLIERTPSEQDRRVNLLTLTPAAAPLLEEIDRVAEELRREVMVDISPEEFQSAMDVLRRLRIRLDQLDEDGPMAESPRAARSR